MEQIGPHKLNIKVLTDVFLSFVEALPKKVLTITNLVETFAKSEHDDFFDRKYFHFIYESKTWRATIERSYTWYKKEWQKITNITLPNDGYVYTDRYVAPNSNSRGLKMEEDSIVLLHTITQCIPPRFQDKSWCSYDSKASRLMLYFKSVKTSELVSVKYEYNYFSGHDKDKVYSREELEELFKTVSK
mmetsp:Transcript_14052/g.21163  ORF Transcript_14052/g.21163 Transcript_14052/m.21163 type:complete len:188 (+) Transcript_14052:201-764(+)